MVPRGFQQLEELRNRVEHRVIEMRETGAPALREQWGEQAAAIAMTIEKRSCKSGKSVAAVTKTSIRTR
jgi:type VI protein secretion system component VasF